MNNLSLPQRLYSSPLDEQEEIDEQEVEHALVVLV